MSYINGSDLLLTVGGKAIGHCTSHTLTMNSETKDRAVKPLASLPVSAGLWKGKGVTGLSISISADGLRFYNETENGFDQVAPQWGQGSAVTVKAFHRGQDETPYLQGSFIIASIEETSPAQDDSTYSISLESAGIPDIYPGKTGGFIGLNASDISLEAGDAFTFVPTVIPAGTTVTYTSNATSVATVGSSTGKVTAVAAGTAVITASITVSGETYTCSCNVTVTSA